MEIVVNGENQEVPETTSALELLNLLKIQPERVVVELNMKILKKEEREKTFLKKGDIVEIVHFVGGGSSKSIWKN